MKLIDSKGRLLGLINIIDLIFILLLLLLLPTLFYAYKLFTREPELEIVERIIPIVIKKIPADSLSQIQIGLSEQDEQGHPIARLSALYDTMPMTDSIISGDNRRKVVSVDSAYRQIHADLWVVAKKLNAMFAFKDIILQDGNYSFNVGKRIDFRPRGHEWLCVVEVAPVAPPPEPVSVIEGQFWVSAEVTFNQVPDSIRSNLKPNHYMKLGQDKIAVIRSILSVSPDSFLIPTRFGTMKKYNPHHCRIQVELDLLCTLKNNDYYWGNHVLTLLESISFQTDTYTINGRIITMRGDIQNIQPDSTLWTWNRMDVLIKGLPSNHVSSIRIADSMVYQGQSVAVIHRIKSVIPDTFWLYINSPLPVKLQSTKKSLLVEMDCRFRNFKRDSILMGDQLITRTGQFVFVASGYAVQAEFLGLTPKQVIRRIKIKIPLEIEEKIPFLKNGTVAYDTLGNRMAEIDQIDQIDSISTKNAVMYWKGGQSGSEEICRQVILTIKLECEQRDKSLYFRQLPLKIGNRILVPFTDFDIDGIILQIAE